MPVVIGLGVLAALYFLSQKNGGVASGVTTPPLPGTVASPIIMSPTLVSGGYQLTPDATMLSDGLGAVSGVSSPSIPPPTTLPPPPPYVAGGIGSGILGLFGTSTGGGAGGNPLGGVLRPGVSSGTPTTSLPTPAYTRITVQQAKQLAAHGYTIVAGNAYAPGSPVPNITRWSGVQVIA